MVTSTPEQATPAASDAPQSKRDLWFERSLTYAMYVLVPLAIMAVVQRLAGYADPVITVIWILFWLSLVIPLAGIVAAVMLVAQDDQPWKTKRFWHHALLPVWWGLTILWLTYWTVGGIEFT